LCVVDEFGKEERQRARAARAKSKQASKLLSLFTLLPFERASAVREYSTTAVQCSRHTAAECAIAVPSCFFFLLQWGAARETATAGETETAGGSRRGYSCSCSYTTARKDTERERERTFRDIPAGRHPE
jgi:hypothetical protein